MQMNAIRTKENMDGICRIFVHQAENVPSVDRFRGLPDPYVNLFYGG